MKDKIQTYLTSILSPVFRILYSIFRFLSTYRKKVLLTSAIIIFTGFLAITYTANQKAYLKTIPPTLLVYDTNDKFLSEIENVDTKEFGYWPIKKIPKRIKDTVVGIEDHNFYYHSGVNFRSVLRAVYQNIKNNKRISGASTISMQVARLQDPGPRTYIKKLTEAITALFLIKRYGHEKILEHYLKIAPYGNRINGIAYASRRYFRKPVNDLSYAEVAFLASIPQSPGRMNPYTLEGSLLATGRGIKILNRLLAIKKISKERHDEAIEQIKIIDFPEKEVRPKYAMHAVLKIQNLLTEKSMNLRKNNDLIIRSTIDLKLQKTIHYFTKKNARALERRGAMNASILVLDLKDNKIVSHLGSTDYFSKNASGSIDYSNIKRQPGSTLKPFIYALALEKGFIKPSTILDDIDRGPGGINNADRIFLGPMLPRVALSNSRNVPAANLLMKIGVDETLTFLRKMGLHKSNKRGVHYGAGLTIGNLPVTLENLVKAYSALATDGRLKPLSWIKGEKKKRSVRVFEEDTVRQITQFLSDPMARLPTFKRMSFSEYPFQVAVKTGTSSNFKDAWAVAYSSRYLVGVWLGHPDYLPMQNVGGFNSASIFTKGILTHLHKEKSDGLNDTVSVAPEGFKSYKLCNLSGKEATPLCNKTTFEWLKETNKPHDFCDVHINLTIDKRNGLLATKKTPKKYMEVRKYINLSPKYSDWAVNNNLPLPPVEISSLDQDFKTFKSVKVIPKGNKNTFKNLKQSNEKIIINITSPKKGYTIIKDPETPPELATIALKGVVDPPKGTGSMVC